MKDDSPRVSERNLAIGDEVVKLAEEIGRSPASVAINWLRQQPGLIIPILGARTPGQLEDNLSSLEFMLDGDHLRRLDEVSGVDLGFPHAFLELDHIRKLLYAGTFERIDTRRAE
jgi:aryl-alcohol dehydrogenase-like predicted oxidoreductase